MCVECESYRRESEPMWISEEVQMAVKEGAAWLDQVYPSWLEAIDLDDLDLSSAHSCILGQVAKPPKDCRVAGYSLIATTATEVFGNRGSDNWLGSHGFCTTEAHRRDDADIENEYMQLQEAWVNLIIERQES